MTGTQKKRGAPSRAIAVLAIAAACSLALAACSSTSSGTPASSGGSGSVNGHGKTIVAFIPSTSNVYVRDDLSAMKAEAKEYGYKFQDIQNNFSETQEDQQVQQYIASGVKPAAFIWWPSDAKAGINSARQLKRIAPVIQTDENLWAGADSSVTAYSGTNQGAVAFIAGQEALKARAAAKAKGMTFHSPGGNLIEFSFTTGYQAGVDRHVQFLKATKSAPFNLLVNQPAPSVDAQGGYTAASQIIPQYKSKGIDFIFCQNNDICVGVIKALLQNGLTPGKDVTVIDGNLSGDPTYWKNGEIYSAVIQSPVIEGQAAIDTVVQYLAAGKVLPGVQQFVATKDKPKVTATAPHFETYQPLAPAIASTISQEQIWGLKFGHFGGGS